MRSKRSKTLGRTTLYGLGFEVNRVLGGEAMVGKKASYRKKGTSAWFLMKPVT